MPLYRARGEAAAVALRDALDGLATPPLASEVRDHDDGSGRWDAGGLFDGPPDAAGLALLAEVHGAAGFTVERVDDRDWVAQVRAELTPVEAGRFVVYGSHDRGRVPPSRIGLEIEAAQAFGTGHHATTQGCLLALDRLAKAGFRPRRVADVGAGTGVLAMAAARLWPLRAVAGRHRPGGDGDRAGERGGERRRRRGWPASPRRGCGIRGCGRGRPTTSSSPTSSPARCGAWRRELAGAQAPGGVAILSGILARQAAAVLATYRGWGYRPAGRGGDRRVADAGAAPRLTVSGRGRSRRRRRGSGRCRRAGRRSAGAARPRWRGGRAGRAACRSSALDAGDDGEDADGAERDGTGRG